MFEQQNWVSGRRGHVRSFYVVTMNSYTSIWEYSVNISRYVSTQ